MPVVPINSDYTNIAEFINSLYDADVRTQSVLDVAIQAGTFTAGFSSEGSKILPVWLAAWQQSQGDPFNQEDYDHCPASDRSLMAYLAGYLLANRLAMFVPQIAYQGASSAGPPIYELSSYQQVNLWSVSSGWDYTAVQQYLELLMYGAHFVVISASEDLPEGPSVTPLWDNFRGTGSINGNQRHDPGNSHYTSVVNLCGEYYPDYTQGSATDPSPFLLAFLVGLTVSLIPCGIKSYNTFSQLEGWEAISSRHNADYAMFNNTYWNISTFGACAYSEKRATAIFLAPPAWAPKPTPETFMPPYVGADTPQGWLQTNLVTLSS